MNITIDQIYDYLRCPMLYNLKYNLDISNTKNINIITKYNLDIKKSIYYIFNKIQLGDSVTANILAKNWGSLWLGNKTQYNIIYSNTHTYKQLANERKIRGLNVLLSVFNYYKNIVGNPILVNKKYSYKIGKINVIGTWDLIRDYNKAIYISHFLINDKRTTKIHIRKDIRITSAIYAFRKLYRVKEDFNILHIVSGETKLRVDKLQRDKEDFKYLLRTIKYIAFSIKNKIFYSRPSDFCINCPYRVKCKDK